jgi:hypothetical protein
VHITVSSAGDHLSLVGLNAAWGALRKGALSAAQECRAVASTGLATFPEGKDKDLFEAALMQLDAALRPEELT